MDSPNPVGQVNLAEIQPAVDCFAQLHSWMGISDQAGRLLWKSGSEITNVVLTDEIANSTLCESLIAMADPREAERIEIHLAGMNRELVSRSQGSNPRLEFKGAVPERSRLVLRSSWSWLRSGEAILISVIDAAGALASNSPSRGFRHDVQQMSPLGLLLMDAFGFILHADPLVEEILGRPKLSLSGQPVTTLLACSPELVQWLACLPGGQDRAEQDIEITRSNGQIAWISLVSHRHQEAAYGYQISVHDISRYVFQNRHLARENTDLANHLQSLSHDLRSPLVTLLGFTRLLRDDHKDVVGEEGRLFMDRIEQAGIKLNSQIDGVHELSRIRLGDDPRSLVDPRELLKQLDAELKSRFDKQGSKLVLPATTPMVLCERNHLYQIFHHLITNAIEHIGECDNHRVEIQIEDMGLEHRIQVRDNGQGIPTQDLERVFEVFYSRAKSQIGKHSNGMGLAIVRRIARTHGGEAWAESTPGQGTNLYVTLPRH